MRLLKTEGCEILYFLHANRVTDAGRRHETLGSETKDFVMCGTASSIRLMFLLVRLAPQVPWSSEEVGSDRYGTYSAWCVTAERP